mmetsp:Transcript_106057/g.304958  ORF Transcript_106057/g.304958 Transcript_106057/m.304958 type:complete len:477 (+) Transcript_106057:113-1543(+)
MSGNKVPKARNAQASRLAQGTRTKLNIAGSDGEAPSCAFCCDRCNSSSVSTLVKRCSPISSGKAAMFSKRNTLFSALSFRTRSANASGSESHASCGTNSTEDAPAATSARSSNKGSDDGNDRMRSATPFNIALCFGFSPPSPPSSPASSVGAAAGSPSSPSGCCASGFGVPRCTKTQTAKGLDSKSVATPAKRLLANSRSSPSSKRNTGASPPAAWPPVADAAFGSRKPRSISYKSTVPPISMLSRLSRFKYCWNRSRIDKAPHRLMRLEATMSSAANEKRSIRGPKQSTATFSMSLPRHSVSRSSSPRLASLADTLAACSSNSASEAPCATGEMKGQFSSEYIARVDLTLPGMDMTMSVTVSYANHHSCDLSGGVSFAARTAWDKSTAICRLSLWTSSGNAVEEGSAWTLSCKSLAHGTPKATGWANGLTMGSLTGRFCGKRPRTGFAWVTGPWARDFWAMLAARFGGVTLAWYV